MSGTTSNAPTDLTAIPAGDRITQNAWTIVAALGGLGILMLLLSGGVITGSRVPFTGSIGAFAFIFAGMVTMWKSEHLGDM